MKNRSYIWKGIFISLLSINLALLVFISPVLLETVLYGPGWALLGVIPYIGLVSFLDFIAILIYLITKNPQGIVRDVSCIALFSLSLVLIYIAYSIFRALCGIDCI